MQNTLFEPTNLPEIANPPMLESLLFESGLLIAVAVFGIGVIIAIVLSKTAKNKQAIIAATVGLLLAAGVFVTSTLVVTPREHIAIHLESLVYAVAEADAETLNELLHESVRVRTRFGGATNRDAVVRLATTRAAPAVTNVRVTETKVGLSGKRTARSLVKVKADSEGPLGSSWWMIDWSRADEQTSAWVATHIEPVWIQGMTNPAGP
jgi:hypothetical protein